VVIWSRVSRASSSTSVDKAEVVRVVIGRVATAHSVPTGIHPEPCRIRIGGKTLTQMAWGSYRGTWWVWDSVPIPG